MTKREKILKGAKYCLTSDPMRCPDECPYLIEGFSCGIDPFLADVIAYLEEQEPIKPDCEHAEYDGVSCLGYCGCTQDDEPIESCKRCEKYTGNISEGQ